MNNTIEKIVNTKFNYFLGNKESFSFDDKYFERFRTSNGGGKCLRVRNILSLICYLIKNNIN